MTIISEALKASRQLISVVGQSIDSVGIRARLLRFRDYRDTETSGRPRSRRRDVPRFVRTEPVRETSPGRKGTELHVAALQSRRHRSHFLFLCHFLAHSPGAARAARAPLPRRVPIRET